MSTTQHPLTEADVADLWNRSVFAGRGRSSFMFHKSQSHIMDALRAAFDAGREHERTQVNPAEVTDEMVEAARRHIESTRFPHLRDTIVAALAVATPADPHHDPRPWQDCTHEDIREGDLVERMAWDLVRIGVAHHQDEDGDWFTRDGMLLSYAGSQDLRRIPAHTTEKDIPMPENTTPAEDARPWEPLNEGDPMRVGYEMKREVNGVTTYTAVVGRVDDDGDPWTAEGGFIGALPDGTWYVRRAAPTAAHTTEKEIPMPETTATPTEPLARTLLAVPEGYSAPHHDASQIKPDDYVMQMDWDGKIRAGKAHHQDEDGDWMTKGSGLITFAFGRADRPDAVTVWPAPTPPAEEVEMPAEHPAHLLDVEGVDGDVCAYMALSLDAHWHGVDQDGVPRKWGPGFITAFTLPDGTRARRDGEHENGKPRFIKVREEEK